jgi:RNA polymerase sigma-70 factor (ECF subfamily)
VNAVPVNLGFEPFYRIEYPGLVAVATALTGDLRDGEDLVQDTMVKAFLHWGRLSGWARPGAWCHRVLMNLCRSKWRRQRTEKRYLAQLRPGEHTVDGPSPDIVAFWVAVRMLPTRPRRVVALYYAADRTTAEVAAILGCPEGTVRSDLARAREVLSAELGV